MAVLNRKHGYLFLAEPYCASRSIETELLCQEGSWHMEAWTHATHAELLRKGYIKRREKLFIFSVIRNPADMLVTRYHHLTSWHERGFQAYLEELLATPPASRSVFMHAQTTNTNIRFENLSIHLNQVLSELGAPTVSLSHMGKSKDKKPWRKYYETGQLETLTNTYRDFKDYGYDVC